MERINQLSKRIFPSGMIVLKPELSDQISSIEELISFFPFDEQTTFVFDKEIQSKTDPTKTFVKYKQFHKDIEVLGGGVTVQVAYNDDDNPCDDVYFLISPHIFTGIDISPETTMTSQQVSSILNASSTQNSKIVFLPRTNCSYHLTWEENYIKEAEERTAYVDAHTEEILSDKLQIHNLTAETVTYGSQNLDDSASGSSICLESSDSPTTVRTFNFQEQDFPLGSIEANFAGGSIYCESEEWGNERLLHQAQYATVEALKGFVSLGYNFGTVNVAILDGEQEVGIGTSTTSTVETSFIFSGIFRSEDGCPNKEIKRRANLLIDVIGHELAHSITNEAFAGVELAFPLSIQEAICDMFGAYVESIHQGYTDWSMGDDEEAINCRLDRNMQSPGFTPNGNLDRGCFSEEFAMFSDSHGRFNTFSSLVLPCEYI